MGGFAGGFGSALLQSTEREKAYSEERKAQERKARLELANLMLSSPDPEKQRMGLAIMMDPSAEIDPSKWGKHPGHEIAKNIADTLGTGANGQAAATRGESGPSQAMAGGNPLTDLFGMPGAQAGSGGGVAEGPEQNMTPRLPPPPPALPSQPAGMSTAPALNQAAAPGAPSPAAAGGPPPPISAPEPTPDPLKALIEDREKPLPYPSSLSPAANAAWEAETLKRGEAARTMRALREGGFEPEDVAAVGLGGGPQFGMGLRQKRTLQDKAKDRNLRRDLADQTIAARREDMDHRFEQAKEMAGIRFGHASALARFHEMSANQRATLAREMGLTREQLEQAGSTMRGFERQLAGVRAHYETELDRLTTAYNTDKIDAAEYTKAVNELHQRTSNTVDNLAQQTKALNDKMGDLVTNKPTLQPGPKLAPATTPGSSLVGTDLGGGFKIRAVRPKR